MESTGRIGSAGPDSQSAGYATSAALDSASFDSQLHEIDNSAWSHPRWMGWRMRLLVATALIGCVGLFLLARWLAHMPHIEATWRGDPQGQIELARSDLPALQPLQGRTLSGISTGTGAVTPLDALVLQRSARWLAVDADRARHAVLNERLSAALAQPTVRLHFGDEVAEVRPRDRGFASLGMMFWLLCTMALALYLASMVVLLSKPSLRNLGYAVMALCQTGNLVFIAVESTVALGLPSGFSTLDMQARMAFDLVTGAAIVHATTLHPTRQPGFGRLAPLLWLPVGALIVLSLRGQLSHAWWWTQAGMLATGLLAIALLTRSYRLEPHPFAVQLRRFGMVAVGTLALLTLAVAAARGQAGVQNTIAGIGSIVWYVFFASLLLLVPFLSRSQHLMREFWLLAAVSTVATSLDLLFVSVFSFSQFASLTLSLFAALGVYAGARQWIVNQLLGTGMLTTERMFEQLYRIAREVEANPQSTASQLSRLLRELFEPLEVLIIDRNQSRTRIGADGSTLLVPVPDLGMQGRDGTGTPSRCVVLRFAHRGRHLFTLEDARLTDRVVEQLRRAIAFDKAVEQGRSEERARLAQDLHDDIGARLLTLMYKAQTPEMEDYVRHTLQDLKTLTRGLAAPSHHLSHAAAEWKADLSQRLSVAHIELGWTMSFDHDMTLSMVQWSALTRVLRELVSNAISHAQATRVNVEFSLDSDQLDLVVSDNGIGCNPQAWAHGLGLGGVRKRVKQLGGEVEWVELRPCGIACRVRIRELSQRR